MLKTFYNLKIYKKITIAFTIIAIFWLGISLYFLLQTNQLIYNFYYSEGFHYPGSEYIYTYNIYDLLSSIYISFFVSSFFIIIIILIVGKFLSDSISKPLNKIVGVIEAISVGQFNIDIPESGDDELGVLAKAAHILKEDLNDLIKDINEFKDEIVLKGNIDHRFIESAYEGGYRELAVSLNRFKESLTTDLIEVVNFVNSIEVGDFDVEIKELPGKKVIITFCLRSLIQNLKDISSEIENLMEGSNSKIDIEKYSGEWQKIMINLNKFKEI